MRDFLLIVISIYKCVERKYFAIYKAFETVYVSYFMFKVHGGTTYKDIERNVLHAEMMALQNEQINANVDTVLFFDEANTTEALGMIKEIMVDRRCNGRTLSDRLKFIVACNPYRKQVEFP